MKDGFTLVEVVILFVIFLTVAVLVVPLSVDDAITTKNNAKWQHVQSSFASIPIDMMNTKSYKDNGVVSLEHFITALIKVLPLRNVVSYKIKYLNGDMPEEKYTFITTPTTVQLLLLNGLMNLKIKMAKIKLRES